MECTASTSLPIHWLESEVEGGEGGNDNNHTKYSFLYES